MPDHDRYPTSIARGTTGGGGLYLIAGALVAAVLVGAYVLLGAPGLYTQVANAPASQKVDATPRQPGTPAPAGSGATPDSAGPASWR